MNKKMALAMCNQKKITVYGDCTFASKNSGSNLYWANPNVTVLGNDWTLFLNDTINSVIHVFNIPAHSIKKGAIVTRKAKPSLIDFQISYNDPNFTDTRSKISFAAWHVAQFNY